MSNASRREYIALLREHYQKSTRYIRGLILSEITRNLGCHRKHAIRLMSPPRQPRRKSGRKRSYSDDSVQVLRKLWIKSRQMCSRRFKEALQDWLPPFPCEERLKLEIMRMSPATMDRYLNPIRADWRRKRNTGTVPNRRLKQMIPVKPLDWNVQEIGHVECDTVAHCGDSLSGLFAWTLTMTDVLTGWTENRAMLGKTGGDVVICLRDIEATLPFALKSFSCDNGNEFLNHHLRRYLKVPLQRGRPYRKNDQCHVEQKNYTHVRDLLGYDRIESLAAVDLINDLFRNEWTLLNNFFLPQFKLLRKTRIGARYKREYTRPQTPYRRLLLQNDIAPEIKAKLTLLFQSLNPFELQKIIELKLKRIYKLQQEHQNQKKIAA